MMAGQMKNWRILRFLIIFIFLSITEQFEAPLCHRPSPAELPVCKQRRGALPHSFNWPYLFNQQVRDDEWEELRPDIAALHHLRGLHEHMFHERIQRDTSIHEARVERSSSRVNTEKNPMSLLDDLQECENFTACIIHMGQDFEGFLTAIDEQKVQDWLLTASEISHSYNRKLLVMTDDEKSTKVRVQQEYSLDPRYSVIVSRDCLNNVSCVPETDSYTVVKIFGHVSEDGRSLSDLSGSSLAELMLESHLEAAPVFSFDGNTTTDFQQNFMRVFTVRGFKVVLETNQEKHQIYQVMDQRDSVSSYRSPQRPVDHTTQYDHQQILIMENNHIVITAAAYLYEKHPTVSSVYVLDANQRPKLIHGESVPLTEDSRLVLVGHGKRENSGEMKLAGYTAQEVSKIIQQTSRDADKIKTTSVVACDVGSDEAFAQTLLRELHETAGIETKLHLRDALLQVRHTGEKITQEISRGGLQWQHKDDSKKVVATLDRNGDVVIRSEPGSRGEAVFTNERNFLMPDHPENYFLKYRDSWPDEPQRFIDPNVFKNKKQIDKIHKACDELEALSWGLFHEDLPPPEKINTQNLQQIELNSYLIGVKIDDNGNMRWMEDEQKLKVLSECYEIKSGKDVRSIIRHYAKTGENGITYLMVNDWIYEVDPVNLYVFPVGKKLDNNQVGVEAKMNEVRNSIRAQRRKGRESYQHMRSQVFGKDQNRKIRYADYVKGIFNTEQTVFDSISNEAWRTTYFTASVISESARNFRTFPLTLMALDLTEREDNNIKEKGWNFLSSEGEVHSMARGGSWIDRSRRGFHGSAAPEGSDKNAGPSTEEGSMGNLEEVLEREIKLLNSWIPADAENRKKLKAVLPQMLEIAKEYKITDNDPNVQNIQNIANDYNDFKTRIGERVKPSTSGTLGGYSDGHVTSQDLKSSSELENSFKLESYFSRTKTLTAEDIHQQMKAEFGEILAGLHLQEGSTRVENGQIIVNVVSEGAEAEPAEFRVKLSPETQRYNKQMLTSIDTAARDLESFSADSSHQVSKYAEHTGTAVGMLGFMLGMKGAVHAFEQGDIKDGVAGSLQTVHGATAMATSVIAKRTLSSEARIARAATAVMKSPVIKGTMKVIPVVGIGFGLYSAVEDFKRGDTLGYIDGALDVAMVVLDVIEIAQPELAPIVMGINVALSVIRMGIDDVYMGIQNELNSLPKDANPLERMVAVLRGFGKGLLHFGIHVASFFYDWHYDEIEEGRRLVAQISDYHKYYTVTKEQDGMSAIDFSSGDSSWNGGGIDFCLADQGQSRLCMNYFVSSDESFTKRCWDIDTQGSQDIILGLGESHQLEHKTLQKKVLLFIPAGSVTVVSGYEAVSYSRYGKYTGNKESNRFFAIQTAQDEHMIEVMLSYYYTLHGEPGDDTFFLGPQRSYVEGSAGKDTYMIPENGGKTIINNYDPSKALDTLHFQVNYSHISVSKSGDDVVLMYEDSHTVTIKGWFLGESYRHMNMISGDGVLFEISSTVVSSVRLVARGINKMFQKRGEVVNASQPLLRTVTNIFGSLHDDVLIGNEEKNLIDGGGGQDHLIGGEGEDIYMIKNRQQSTVLIENYSIDNKTDVAIIEADLHSFKVRVEGDNVVLNALHNNVFIHVTLLRWFRSPADRHLLFVTKDLITFTISDKKTDCLQRDPFTKCIKSRSIDYSSSPSALVVDLQQDEALDSVTEVRGSKFSDVIKGNKEHNVFIPGGGNDFLQGREAEDWYVITPGEGVKTINNQSPDRATDIVFLQEKYQHIRCTCEGQNINILVNGTREVILQNWFNSKNFQHLHIKTSDGITAGLTSNRSSCDESLMFPLTVDYRNQKPEPLTSPQTRLQAHSVQAEDDSGSSGHKDCFRYRSKDSEDRFFCGRQGKVMMMTNSDSVKEMHGSPGFDIMVGSSNDNLLDPYTGGALMFGGKGKDTYVIKHGYGDKLLIDNFAEDGNIDTVLVDMDFLDGGQIAVDSSTGDLNVTITTNREEIKISLLNYNNGFQHQHLQFESSDGVNFKLKLQNSTGDVPFVHIEAFKVALKQSQGDCRLDLSSQRNLSKVHTVQGCPFQSNDIWGNDGDNALIGGWKDDVLDGGEGDDTLIGGSGDDILIGNLGDDTFYGEDGNDTMMGNTGRDVFIPGPGADLVDGGPGRDIVLYRGDHKKGKGVYVNLLTGQGRYADAEGDVLKDVETVIGTIYSDILVSGYESSLLKGSDGNDLLVSTGGDYLVGGDGNDIYMLAFQHGSVTINNCAKDNATDVLYWSSRSTPIFDCQLSSDRLLLTSSGNNKAKIKISLQGWTSDDGECGHLKLVFGDQEVSVNQLLQECQFRQKKAVSSPAIKLDFLHQSLHLSPCFYCKNIQKIKHQNNRHKNNQKLMLMQNQFP